MATRLRSAVVLPAKRASAFVGENTWLDPFGGDACDAHADASRNVGAGERCAHASPPDSPR